MVMLVNICASRQGPDVFRARNNLLITLSELLLFAPQARKPVHLSTYGCAGCAMPDCRDHRTAHWALQAGECGLWEVDAEFVRGGRQGVGLADS